MSPRMMMLIIVLSLITLIGGGAAWQEHRVAAMKTQRDGALAAAAAAEAEANSEQVTTKVVTQYVDRVRIVREVGATITKEIPVYVTAHADAACPVPVGFVRLHDAAAAGRVPEPAAGDPDAPAPGLALSAVADTVADNYASCHATAEQLIALQSWIDQHLQPEPAK